jgi:hypothetical protein
MMACLQIPKDKQEQSEIASSERTRKKKRMVDAGSMIGNNQGTSTNKQQKKRWKTVHRKSIELCEGSTGC